MSKYRRVSMAGQGAVEYRIDPSLPRYDRVPVANVGSHRPSGWYLNDGIWSPDRAYFENFVKSYDPLWFVATLNRDHDGWWGGPALGLVTALSTDGAGDKAVLYADLANVDTELAAEIDQGKWPVRSIEWYDAANALYYYTQNARPGEGLPQLEDFLFYDKYELYFTGLAALGLIWPAVPGLGPWPERSAEANKLINLPAAALQPAPAWNGSSPAVVYRAIHLTPKQEGTPMAAEKAEAQKKPPEQGGADDIAAIKAENEQLKADLTATTEERDKLKSAASVQEDATTAAVRAEIQAEREARQRVEAQLKATLRDGDVKGRLQAHLRQGRLTTQQQRSAYSQLAAALHGKAAAEIITPDGSKATQQKTPLELLDEIIAGFPAQATLAMVAGDEEPGLSDSDTGAHVTARGEAIKQLAEKNRGGAA